MPTATAITTAAGVTAAAGVPARAALAGPLSRWRAERRAFRELLAGYERGGYQPSPPMWQRLRDEARAQARAAARF